MDEGDYIFRPEDLLPMRMLQARAFGYDADVYHLWFMPASNNTIKDHADNPTASLIGLRLGGTKKRHVLSYWWLSVSVAWPVQK